MRKVRTPYICLFVGAAAAGVCLCLQSLLEFHFFSMERHQIFRMDWSSVRNDLVTLGGLSKVLSEGFVQFFCIPGIGAMTTALLAAAGAVLTWMTARSMDSSRWLLPLCFVPVLTGTVSLSDPLYLYQGWVALILGTALLFAYARISRKTAPFGRVLAGMLTALAAFLTAGSIAVPVAFAIVLYDLAAGRKEWPLQLLSPLLTAAAGTAFFFSGKTVDLVHTFLPDWYYEPLVRTGFRHLVPWLALLLLFPTVFLSGLLRIRWHKLQSPMVQWMLCLVLTAFVGTGYLEYARSANDRKITDILRLDHLVAHEDWDGVLSDPSRHSTNYLAMNCRNLAMAHEGMLLTNLFDYPQDGPEGLMVRRDGNERTPQIAELLSNIYFGMGIVAGAQNMAFDASVGFPAGDPYMVRRLVQTNLVLGSENVARKYIEDLEKTLFHRKWAASRRHFLGHPEAVAEDPLLGSLQKGLVQKDAFIGSFDAYDDLKNILEEHPDNLNARDWFLACLLLSKDVAGLRSFVDGHFDSRTLPSVPVLLQEAIVTYSENDLDYCRSHGVEETTIQRYNAFKKKFIVLRDSGTDPVGLMRKDYGRTFWFYFLFKKTD